MSLTIKELSLSYDPVNESNTFSSGDLLQGRVFLEVAKEVKIDSLYIKFKSDADVKWSERHNDRDHHYHSHERYFKLKQYFIQDPSKKGKEDPGVILTSGEIYSNVVKPGRHVYPFSFQLPQGNLPPPFKGNYGSIKYILDVTVDRSWKMDRNTTREIFFVPRIVVFGSPLMNPQSGSTDKKMKLFTSGSASLSATIDKMGYMQGEVIQVSTNIENSSSRDLKPKYCLEQKQMFSAQGSHKYTTKTIFKVVGDPIPSGSKSNLITNLTIPSNLEMTISNCSIIKVDYVLKVYLDVPYASDPEIKFPVIILPAGQLFGPLQGQPGVPAYGSPNQTAWGNPAPQPGFGPPPPGAAFGPPPPGAAFGPPPPSAAFGPPPPGVAFGPPPPSAAFGPPPPGVAFGPPPPGAAFGPTPGPYVNQYPTASKSPTPPPSYLDIYPDSYSAAPGSLAGPSVPTFSPPQYPGVEFPAVPQQLPSAPDFFQHPTAPPYDPADGPGGFWPNTSNAPSQPNSYPTKSESHE